MVGRKQRLAATSWFELLIQTATSAGPANRSGEISLGDHPDRHTSGPLPNSQNAAAQGAIQTPNMNHSFRIPLSYALIGNYFLVNILDAEIPLAKS